MYVCYNSSVTGYLQCAKIYTAHSALWRVGQLINKQLCDKHNAASSLKQQRCDKHNAVSSFLDYYCGSFILLSAPLETAAVPVSLVALQQRTQVFFVVSLHVQVSVHQLLAQLECLQQSRQTGKAMLSSWTPGICCIFV